MTTGKISEQKQQQRLCNEQPQIIVNNFPGNQDTFKNPNVQEVQQAKMTRQTYTIKTIRYY